jgi:hypothetical protein
MVGLDGSTMAGGRIRSLQTTWAKLSLTTRARFPRTPEEERQDGRWVVDDEVIRVAAEEEGGRRRQRTRSR